MVSCLLLLLLLLFFFSSSSILQSTATLWIDEQTPAAFRTDAATGYSLVFSDEFNDPKRSFADGDDTRWTAEDRPGVTNAALHYYNSSTVYTTDDGKLAIASKRDWARWTEYDSSDGNANSFQRPYQSGLISTWNKFCFTGGIIEVSVQLPGSHNQPGLWPAFWMLGNLARPGYLTSTQGIWPWSYDACGNSSSEAAEAAAAQAMNACNGSRGRGSPEIDIIEAQPGNNEVLKYSNVPFIDGTRRNMSLAKPHISSSLQLSPGIANNLRAKSPNFPNNANWYPSLFPLGGSAYGNASQSHTIRSMINHYWYGQLIQDNPPLWQDGLSVNWEHPDTYYTQQTVIRTEWQPGQYVRWYNGEGQLVYQITQDMLNARPGAADAIPQIPYEAMYLILNTDISPKWGWNACDRRSPCALANSGFCSAESQLTCTDCGDPECLTICPEATSWLADFCQEIHPDNPAEFLIDYVRVYQNPNDASHSVTCDPVGLETSEYINENWEKYTFNPFVKKEPLKVVRRGGGSCVEDVDCRGRNQQEGICSSGFCICPAEWTGPNCLSPCVGAFAGDCSSGIPSSSPSSSPPTVDRDASSLAPSDTDSNELSEVPSLAPGEASHSTLLPSATSNSQQPSEDIISSGSRPALSFSMTRLLLIGVIIFAHG